VKPKCEVGRSRPIYFLLFMSRFPISLRGVPPAPLPPPSSPQAPLRRGPRPHPPMVLLAGPPRLAAAGEVWLPGADYEVVDAMPPAPRNLLCLYCVSPPPPCSLARPNQVGPANGPSAIAIRRGGEIFFQARTLHRAPPQLAHGSDKPSWPQPTSPGGGGAGCGESLSRERFRNDCTDVTTDAH